MLGSDENSSLVLGPVFFSMEVDGKPQPKGRHRSRIVYPRKGKPFIHNYADAETEAYEKMLAQYAVLLMRGKQPTQNPIALSVCALLPMPASWSVKKREQALAGIILPTSKPDFDNFCKAASDALNKIVFHDDAQVVEAHTIKRYDARPRLCIEVREFVAPR
jgi:Holliday junction resolvase RusA-like endonuclease